MTKVAVAAGGTGGHIYPALATAKVLDKKASVMFIGTRFGLEKTIIPKTGYAFETIYMRPVRGKGLARKLVMPIMLTFATISAALCLKRNKVDVVLTMGGYVSAPVGLAAKLLRIPLIVHEQNAVAGLTNRLLHRFANRTLEAYPKAFGDSSVKTVGNPVRDELLAVAPVPSTSTTRILVLGGSQGASSINKMMPEVLKQLSKENYKLEVLHQSGKDAYVQTQTEYNRLKVKANVVSYIDNMPEAYANADIAIARAGAMTCAELLTIGLPCILIPYPNAVDDHQSKNAEQLVEMGLAVMIQQRDLTTDLLATQLKAWIESPAKLKLMREDAARFAHKDAAQTVAEECLNYA